MKEQEASPALAGIENSGAPTDEICYFGATVRSV